MRPLWNICLYAKLCASYCLFWRQIQANTKLILVPGHLIPSSKERRNFTLLLSSLRSKGLSGLSLDVAYLRRCFVSCNALRVNEYTNPREQNAEDQLQWCVTPLRSLFQTK